MKTKVGSKKRKKFRSNELAPGWNIFLTILLSVLAIAMVLPFVLVISVSFSSATDLAKYGYSFIPKQISFDAYKALVKTGYTLVQSYMMTIFYAGVGTLLSLFVMSMVAYVLAKPDYPFRRGLSFYIFFTTLFSGGLVPTYIMNTRYLHINDSIWIFLLPSLVQAFNVIVLRTFVKTSIPASLFDAAKIDGANDWQIYVRVVLPLFKAGLATIGLFNVVSRWNDWFTGMLYIEKRSLTPVMTMLQEMQNNIDYLKNDPLASMTPDGMEALRQIPTESTRMAITLIVSLPLLIAYPFFQKYFVKGMTVGSIKG